MISKRFWLKLSFSYSISDTLSHLSLGFLQLSKWTLVYVASEFVTEQLTIVSAPAIYHCHERQTELCLLLMHRLWLSPLKLTPISFLPLTSHRQTNAGTLSSKKTTSQNSTRKSQRKNLGFFWELYTALRYPETKRFDIRLHNSMWMKCDPKS